MDAELIERWNAELIERWNRKVHRNDTVYIVGDFIFRCHRPPEEYFDLLKGKKHLILGNHDKY
ncbi:MAG: hydrolase, partial [Clostridia bacterium]|nr:hydrolase [Clostridia bacterium]